MHFTFLVGWAELGLWNLIGNWAKFNCNIKGNFPIAASDMRENYWRVISVFCTYSVETLICLYKRVRLSCNI